MTSVHEIDPTEYPKTSGVITIGVITASLWGLSKMITAGGAAYKDRKQGKATEISSKRDDNPEVEVELGNDEESF